jgi:hypothetical protein
LRDLGGRERFAFTGASNCASSAGLERGGRVQSHAVAIVPSSIVASTSTGRFETVPLAV